MPHDAQSLGLPVIPSPHKRVKRVASAAQPSTRRRVRGSLSPLLRDVPLEVLHMVCGFMHPRDLLALARTNKALRKMIWSKSFKRAWESSLTTVEQSDAHPFPVEAPDMSPAAYALLAFGSWCYHCQKGARLIHWALGIRLCAFCSKTQLVHAEDLADRYLETYNLSPHQCSALYNLLCKIPWIHTRRNQYENYAYRSHAFRDADRWLSLGAAGRAAFEQERKALADLQRKHASLCESWMDYCASQREKHLADLRANRLSQIFERLCNLGWAEEVRRERKTLCEHRRVMEAKVLTEKAWAALQPELLCLLQRSRAEHELHLRYLDVRKDVKKFLNNVLVNVISPKEAQPTLEDIEYDEFFPDVMALLDPDLEDAERERLEAIALRTFPRAVEAWRHSCAMQLSDYIPDDVMSSDDASDVERLAALNLATTAFSCTACRLDDIGKHAHYPYILAHVHLYHPNQCRGVWSPSNMQFNVHGRDIIEELVRISGLNPATATCQDVDIRDARIVCAVCYEDGPYNASAMTWWRCIEHIEQKHGGSVSLDDWFALDAEEEARVRELAPRRSLADCGGWDCRLCSTILSDWQAVLSHFLEEHPTENADAVPDVGIDVVYIDSYIQQHEPRNVWLCILDGDTDALECWIRGSGRPGDEC